MTNEIKNTEIYYCETRVQVLNKVGLHARPAAVFVKNAMNCQSNICVEKNGKEIDAKSIFGVLSLGIDQFDFINIKAQGKDAKEAIRTLTQLVNNKFGEE